MKKLLSVTLCLIVILSVICVPISAEAAKVAKVNSLKVTAVSVNSVTLKWKKVKKASGYQVYCSTAKNKGYKKVKTIKKGKTVTAKISNLNDNKKYYFKVRAVKGKSKGKFSKVVSKKTSLQPFVNCNTRFEPVGNYYIYLWSDFEKKESYVISRKINQNKSKKIYTGGYYQLISVISDGKTVYYSAKKESESDLSCDVYSVSVNGKNRKKIFTKKGDIRLSSCSGGILYYEQQIFDEVQQEDSEETNSVSEGWDLCSYNLKTKASIALIKDMTNDIGDGCVTAAYGSKLLISTDDKGLLLYNAKSKKSVNIYNKQAFASFSSNGKKIYYAVIQTGDDAEYNMRYVVYSSTLDGKTKKKIAYTKWLWEEELFFDSIGAYGCYFTDDDSKAYMLSFKNNKLIKK